MEGNEHQDAIQMLAGDRAVLTQNGGGEGRHLLGKQKEGLRSQHLQAGRRNKSLPGSPVSHCSIYNAELGGPRPAHRSDVQREVLEEEHT